MKRYIRHSESDKPWWLVNVQIPDKESEEDKQKRLQLELADEEDAYDLEHGEGIYSDD